MRYKTKILNEREKEYGSFYKNHATIGRIWGALLDIEDIPAWQVGLMMDALKTVRIFQNPAHDDSWRDKIGYIEGSAVSAAVRLDK